MRRIIITLALTLAVVLPLSASKSSLGKKFTEDNPMRVLCDWNYPPYEYLDDDGYPAGYCVELIDRLLKNLNIPHKFVMQDSYKQWEMLASNDFDLSTGGLVSRDSADAGFHYGNIPIAYYSLSLWRSGDTHEIIKAAALGGKTIVVSDGDYSISELKRRGIHFHYKETSDVHAALQSITDGEAQYMLWNDYNATWAKQKYGFKDVKSSSVDIPNLNVYFISPDKDILQTLEDELVKIVQTGELETLQKKWFTDAGEEKMGDTAKKILWWLAGIIAVSVVLWLAGRVMKNRIQKAKERMSELNKICDEALILGDMHFASLDRNTMQWEGSQIEARRVHPDDKAAFDEVQRIIDGEIRSMHSTVRYNAGTEGREKWKYYDITAATMDRRSRRDAGMVVFTYRDITEETLERNSVHETVSRYTSLLDSVLMGISIYDKDGLLLNSTDAMKRMFGTDRFDVYVPGKYNLFNGMLGPCVPLGEDESLICSHHVMVPKYDIDFYCDIQTKTIYEDGKLKYVMLTALDVTEERLTTMQLKKSADNFLSTEQRLKKQSEMLNYVMEANKAKVNELISIQNQIKEETKKIENSDQMKSVFLANMSHEIRTPLNAIVGFSQLLEAADDSDKKEFLRIISNNCDMLLRLINDVMYMSEMDSGTDYLIPTDVNWAENFDDICKSLAQRVSNPDVEFISVNPYTMFRTKLDASRLNQVITNFVTNAVKYTRKGHIKVGYEYMRRGLYIFCEDTGAGIPAEKKDRVFERFVKLNDYVQGTGLGLSICKAIVEKCGGNIGVNSEEGKGSTFWMWIPCECREKR